MYIYMFVLIIFEMKINELGLNLKFLKKKGMAQPLFL